jgi:KDO2-lipid IV(A) lauroyltransferase
MKIGHGLEYVAFWLLTRFVQLIPAGAADAVAVCLGKATYRLLSSRRKITIDNLRRAFKSSLDETEILRIARCAFINVAREAIEFCRLPRLSKAKMNRMVIEQTGLEYIKQANENEKGGILVTGHIGNGEYLGAWLVYQDLPVDFLTGVQHNPYVNRMFNDFRKTCGAGIIPVGVAGRHALRALKKGRIIALMSDQHSATASTVVEFFGRPAATPKGAAAFAVATNCPVIPGVLLRKKYNQFKAIIAPPIYPDKTIDKETEINNITQKYTGILEKFIRDYPDQWMWTHRRWKLD